MIEISNVCKTYEAGNKALRNVSITIGDGEFVFIMGRSGSGKSTLVRAAFGMLKQATISGQILLNGTDVAEGSRAYFR